MFQLTDDRDWLVKFLLRFVDLSQHIAGTTCTVRADGSKSNLSVRSPLSQRGSYLPPG